MRKPYQYWDEGVTLVSGCTPCSPGCDNCWALAMERRFNKQSPVTFYPKRLDRFYKQSPTVFSIWNDFYHEDITDYQRCAAYAAMAENSQSTFLALTKRPQNINNIYFSDGVIPTNIWRGLTVCTQEEADEKIPIFLKVPGKKFLSIEPMLGEVEFGDGFNAVILGCETGANARPMKFDWAYSVAVQCELAGIPLFTKALTIDGKPNTNIEQWPEVLRIRQLVW